MRCGHCKRSIGKPDEAKSVRTYWLTGEDGSKQEATDKLGPMAHVYHRRCWNTRSKERERMLSVYDADRVFNQREGRGDDDQAREAAQRALAMAEQNKTLDSRRVDPGHVEREDSDWRDQTTMNVEDVPKVSEEQVATAPITPINKEE